MTVAVTIKVSDGVVMASDSAATITSGPGIMNVYNNANKMLNLHKSFPIGVQFWGAGSIGERSLTSLAKDLRAMFSDGDEEWKLDADSYTMEEVAKKLHKFLYELKYQEAHKPGPNLYPMPSFGLHLAGYSAKTDYPEVWRIEVVQGKSDGPTCHLGKDRIGAIAGGDAEAIVRLLDGYGSRLPVMLNQMLKCSAGDFTKLMNSIRNNMRANVVVAPMPIKDAIDLARFLVHTSVMWSRFTPGPPTIGGPIEIAAITQHESFKWVDRKFYYDQKYNLT